MKDAGKRKPNMFKLALIGLTTGLIIGIIPTVIFCYFVNSYHIKRDITNSYPILTAISFSTLIGIIFTVIYTLQVLGNEGFGLYGYIFIYFLFFVVFAFLITGLIVGIHFKYKDTKPNKTNTKIEINQNRKNWTCPQCGSVNKFLPFDRLKCANCNYTLTVKGGIKIHE